MGRKDVQFLTIVLTMTLLLTTGWACKDVHSSVDNSHRAATQFAFAKHFQDHMVLQQAPAKANVYGFSPDIGQEVNLQLVMSPLPIEYETTVKQGPEPGMGVWSFTLDPIRGNTTVSIKVGSGGVFLTLIDVLVGDVWICSGQSNMEFTVSQMFGADEEIENAHNYPNIRIMTVEDAQSSTPLYDLSQIRQAWTAPNNESVGGPAWQYFSAVCWLYGKSIYKALSYPIGLVASDWGGTPIEAWSSPEALAKCGVNTSATVSQHSSLHNSNVKTLRQEKLEGPSNNSVLWNAMIYPLLGMTIKGVVWYQGENDASGEMMNRYNCTFPTMIRDWRYNFYNSSNQQTDVLFPFGFVQLAPNSPNPDITQGFPDIRWHQTVDHGFVPNTDMINVFMAVTIDLPDFNSPYGSVHPRDKIDAADRLVLSALAIAYGRDLLFQGPFPQDGQFLPDRLVISYGDRWNLDVRTTTGFEFLCNNATGGTWTTTQIIASNQTSITLQLNCTTGHETTGLRYAWRESPCEFKNCAIYESRNLLPAPPFVFEISENDKVLPYFQFGRKFVHKQ